MATLRGEEGQSGTRGALGMIPNYYLQCLPYRAHKLADQLSSRAEAVMAIEGSLLAEYAEPDRSGLQPIAVAPITQQLLHSFSMHTTTTLARSTS